MHERELGAELGRYLDRFGPYDRRHTAALFGRLPARGTADRTTLALAGAALAAAIVLTALLAPRLLSATRKVVPAVPPTVRASTSPPPAATAPVLVVQPGGTVSSSVRVGWDGHRLGSVASPPPGTEFISTSPDGRLALAGESSSSGYTLFDTADGHVVGSVAPGLSGTRWGDDSRHLCGVTSTGTTPQLAVVTLDPKRGETGRRAFPIDVVGAGPTFVAACSGESDRAVLTRFWVVDGTQAAGVVDVLRLSTGATLLHRAFPAPAPFINVYASPDGLFLVGSPLDGVGSTVVDLVTGREVAHLDGVALAFTADDRYLAISSFVAETGKPGGTGRLVEWRTGRTVWQDHGQLAILGVEPDGQAIAVQLYGSDQEPPDHDVWLIVQPDGSTITLRRNGVGP